MKHRRRHYYSVTVAYGTVRGIVKAYEVSVFDPKSDIEKVEFYPNSELHKLTNKSYVFRVFNFDHV